MTATEMADRLEAKRDGHPVTLTDAEVCHLIRKLRAADECVGRVEFDTDQWDVGGIPNAAFYRGLKKAIQAYDRADEEQEPRGDV